MSSEEDPQPLTLAEKKILAESINRLPADVLKEVIQIIRQASNLSDDCDEIDLEIDQLDAATQRKLLRTVSNIHPAEGDRFGNDG